MDEQMEEQIAFVLAETVGGTRSKDQVWRTDTQTTYAKGYILYVLVVYKLGMVSWNFSVVFMIYIHSAKLLFATVSMYVYALHILVCTCLISVGNGHGPY